ncbi:sensor histidine kinase [Pseudodesulfovibrio sediminis]|uniref:histidine kinase n=1 Tax=Pseudodesulfovibrio sediminis TaxID=2810563 RepID=A0ABN6ETS5_9BACT|nr:PAS domain-containing sensor histidine kinase [Pseudodesulfovibrio sediminis]BCS89746.1 two-component sensor histidine kinase [Pseudodesulfovibrio sediminis]
MHPEKKSSYEGLSRNIVLTVITVSMAPLILVGGLIFHQFRSIYRVKVYSHLCEVVDKHKDTVNTFLLEKLNEVQYLSRAYSYAELTAPGVLSETLRGMQQQYGRIFVDLGIVDEQGRQVSYAGPFNLLDADYAEADWYVNSRDRASSISDVFLGLRQSPHFIISINSEDADRKWTLRATIDFLAFTHLVENIRIGETGYAYILNSEGVFQTRHADNREQRLTLTPVKNIPYPEAPQGVTISESEGSDGETYLTISSDLKNGEWQLVYQQSVADAFSDMSRTENITLLVFLLGGLCIVVMAVVVSRKLVHRCKFIDAESELLNRQMVETGKLAAIGELAAGIAHEINNPVAIMIEEAGWVSDLLEDEGGELPSCSEIDRALAQVATQGRRCKDITHKLLSFARQTDSRVGEVDLPLLIREVVEISMQQARCVRVEFSLDLDESVPSVHASVTELQQVLLNLINNAIQAMESDGGTLAIACFADSSHAIMEVADTGPGIPAANLSRIFDPFFTTKPVGKGSGLGLSICFGIIHQMGGEIDVESTVGVGTRFTIRLPLPHVSHEQKTVAKEIHHV